MKVAFYRHSLLNRGGDKMVITYVNHMVDNGNDVEIYVNNVDSLFHIDSRVRIKKIPLGGILGTVVWAITSRIDADLIVTDIVALAGMLRASGKRRVVYFSQGNDVYHYRNRAMRTITDFLYRLTLGKLRVPCIAVSQSLAFEMSRYGHNISVVENGIDLATFEGTKSEERNNYSEYSVLVFNRRDHPKGVDEGLTVLASVKEILDLKVFVVGETLNNFGCENLSYLDSLGLAKVLKNIDVLFYPSRHEGFGLLPLECLGSGRPVVTTKAVKFVEHLKTGWVAEVGDTRDMSKGIFKLFTDKKFYKRLAFNGVKLAGRFDLERSKSLFFNRLRDICQVGFDSS